MATRYYTFRKNVRLLPGQVIQFLSGKGYFAFGKPTPPAGPITMYDSVDISQIPKDAAAVAGYVGGHWPTYMKLATAFPHAHKLSIAISAAEDAEVLDVENGDATNDQAPAWFRRQLRRGLTHPKVYTSASNVMTLLAALKSAGIIVPFNDVWSAHYTGKPHRCSSACGYGITGTVGATQYDSHALGKNLDASLCAPTFFPADV